MNHLIYGHKQRLQVGDNGWMTIVGGGVEPRNIEMPTEDEARRTQPDLATADFIKYGLSSSLLF